MDPLDLLIFCLLTLIISEKRVLMSSTVIMDLLVSLFLTYFSVTLRYMSYSSYNSWWVSSFYLTLLCTLLCLIWIFIHLLFLQRHLFISVFITFRKCSPLISSISILFFYFFLRITKARCFISYLFLKNFLLGKRIPMPRQMRWM